jgi:uncharacterized protein with ATP-grasp and redox domains
MKLSQHCYECLTRLVHQAAELATDNMQVREKAIESGLRILDEEFSCDEVSIVVATHIHEAIKNVTGNQDPYRDMKQSEIKVAKELYGEVLSNYGNAFGELLKLAALGNTIDFFRPLDVIRNDMKREVHFAINHAKLFYRKLNAANKILYLADNAGEVFFDLSLLNWMRQFASVKYVVKGYPVQNDITMEDIRNSGLENALGDIISTGTATPGIVFSLASSEFKDNFKQADLILAKGMGYYESLSEMPPEGKVFYCLKAKCQPVASSLNVPFNSFIAMLR